MGFDEKISVCSGPLLEQSLLFYRMLDSLLIYFVVIWGM